MQEGLIVASQFNKKKGRVVGKQSGFIDSTGKVILPLIYSDAQSFSEGLAAVMTWDSIRVREVYQRVPRWGYIDKSGRMVIAQRYHTAPRFKNGAALVSMLSKDEQEKLHEGYGFINKDGHEITRLLYSTAQLSSRPHVYILKLSDPERRWMKKSGMTDAFGKLVIPAIYEDIQVYGSHFAIVKQRQRDSVFYGFFDYAAEKFLLPCHYEQISEFDHEHLLLIKNDQYGMADLNGNILIPMVYNRVEWYKGYVLLQKAGRIGLCDFNHRIIVPVVYDSIEEVEGLFMVRKGREVFYFDKNGVKH